MMLEKKVCFHIAGNVLKSIQSKQNGRQVMSFLNISLKVFPQYKLKYQNTLHTCLAAWSSG